MFDTCEVVNEKKIFCQNELAFSCNRHNEKSSNRSLPSVLPFCIPFSCLQSLFPSIAFISLIEKVQRRNSMFTILFSTSVSLSFFLSFLQAFTFILLLQLQSASQCPHLCTQIIRLYSSYCLGSYCLCFSSLRSFALFSPSF